MKDTKEKEGMEENGEKGRKRREEKNTWKTGISHCTQQPKSFTQNLINASPLLTHGGVSEMATAGYQERERKLMAHK